MKGFTKILASMILGVMVTGCSSILQPTPTPTPTLDPENPVFEIKMNEFAFIPDRIELKVGQNVTFHVTNVGATEHEIMIGRNPLRDENGSLGDGFEHDFFALTKPDVTGDAQVMGLESGGMDMNMGSSTPEGEMAMETPTPGAGMAMDTSTPEAGMEGMDMGESSMENGFMAMFEPQQEATIKFTVTDDMLGTWTLGCFETSSGKVHFDQGMAGIVVVLPE